MGPTIQTSVDPATIKAPTEATRIMMMASVPVTEVGARGSQIGEKKSDSRSPRLPVLNQGSSILIREYQGASGIKIRDPSHGGIRGPLASGSPGPLGTQGTSGISGIPRIRIMEGVIRFPP